MSTLLHKKLHGGSHNRIVSSTPLGRVLKAVFPKDKACLRLLSLAYCLVINKDSSLCNCEEFAECTRLPYSEGVSRGSISRLLQSIDKNKIACFLNKSNT